MRTESIKQKDITRDWYIVDAEGQNLGRLASHVAQVLRGKGKPFFTPHMNMGDFVIVVNADKVSVTGSKETAKTYFRHSGFPGGTKEIDLMTMRQKHPERVVMHAVKGMLPHNRLGRKILKSLKVYNGPEHPHTAQQPKPIEM